MSVRHYTCHDPSRAGIKDIFPWNFSLLLASVGSRATASVSLVGALCDAGRDVTCPSANGGGHGGWIYGRGPGKAYSLSLEMAFANSRPFSSQLTAQSEHT